MASDAFTRLLPRLIPWRCDVAMGSSCRRLLALVVTVLAFAGCGDSDEPANDQSASNGSATPAPTATAAEEPPLQEAPALDRSNLRASAVTFKLEQEHQSERSGEAAVQARGRRSVRVLVRLSYRKDGSNAAHIHDVTCAQYRRMRDFSDQQDTIVDHLSAVQTGSSDTTLSGVSLEKRSNGQYSINVHENTPPYKTVACGDIPRR
jgi:hypothetical protein